MTDAEKWATNVLSEIGSDPKRFDSVADLGEKIAAVISDVFKADALRRPMVDRVAALAFAVGCVEEMAARHAPQEAVSTALDEMRAIFDIALLGVRAEEDAEDLPQTIGEC